MMESMNKTLKYTIMADCGNASWAWLKDATDESTLVGSNCADSLGWTGHHSITKALETDFITWAVYFEGQDHNSMDWDSFHKQGHALCSRLKDELGNVAKVCYVQPSEEPAEDFTHGVEFLLGGGTKSYVRTR